MGEKYTQDIARADMIAPELQRRIREKFDTYAHLGNRVMDAFGLRQSSSHALIANFCKGYFVAHISTDVPHRKLTAVYLDRLAAVYQLLEIDPGDDLIRLTKEINPAFVYPLPKSEGEPTISITFSEPHFLTSAQLENLEMLARRYVLANRRKP